MIENGASKGRRLALAVVAILLLSGAVGLLSLTRRGLGMSPDSVVYVGAARNLLSGYGLSVPFGNTINAPLTHHAPLYSLLLAAAGFLGMELLPAARWLNTLLFGGNALLVGVILVRIAGQRFWLVAAGMVLALTAIPLLAIHVMAWTEPLFLLLAFSGLLLLDYYLERGRRSLLLGAGLLIGCAFLVRYAGATLVATGILGVVGLGGGGHSFRRRVTDAALFGVSSSFLMGIWLLRNMAVAGTATNRALIVHSLSMAQMWQAVFTTSSWLLVPTVTPGAVRVGLWLLVVVALGAILMLRWRESDKGAVHYFLKGAELPRLVHLLTLFLVIYVAFVLLSLSFLDANIPLDNRILSPVYVVLLILFSYIGGEWTRLVGDGLVRRAMFLFLALFLALHVVSGVRWVLTAREQGAGLSSRVWQQSPTMVKARELPAGITIITNAPEIVYLHTARPALLLPQKVESTTKQANAHYGRELERVKEQVEQGEAAIIYFTRLERTAVASEDDLRELFWGDSVLKTADGFVYRAELLDDS